MVGGQGVDIGRLGQDHPRPRQHLGAGGGQAFEALAAAQEELQAELVLHLADLLGKARLGGVHLARGHGDVHARIDDGRQVTQLDQRHRRRRWSGLGSRTLGTGGSRWNSKPTI